MGLRERRHADAEPAQPVRQLDQLAGVRQPARGRRPGGARPLLRVAAQGEHVADPGLAVGAQDVDELLAGVPDARQVAHRAQGRLPGDPPGDGDRRVAGRAAGAVGHRHERRLVRLQVADRGPQLLDAGLVLRRHELERDRPLTSADQLPDAAPVVHAHQSREGRRRLASPHDLVGRQCVPGAAPEGPRRLPRRDGRTGRPARARRRRAARGGPPFGVRWQAVPGGVLLVGLPRVPAGRRGRGRAAARVRGPGAAARQRPGPRRLHGRLGHPAGPAGDAPRVRLGAPGGRLARRPGAVRRRRGHPARRPAALVVRRAAAPLRAARRPGGDRARAVRPVPDRGDHRAVPRRVACRPAAGPTSRPR